MRRFVYWFLRTFLSHYAWARRLHRGRWEEWWVDPCNAYVWLYEPTYLAGCNRPGGCAIYACVPAPRAVEDYQLDVIGRRKRPSRGKYEH